MQDSEETTATPDQLSPERQDELRGLAYLAILSLVEHGIVALRSELSYSNIDDEPDLPRVTALQVLYVFLLGTGSWSRARERWISAIRSLED